ncbi:MAG: hypothetical protein U0529_21755 [Thermoanaerobaculia bacterium]
MTPGPVSRRAPLSPAILLPLLLSGCSLKPADPPYTAERWPEPQATVVWVGWGAAYERAGDGWKRTPENDYELTVVQRRYADRWETLKTLLRRHPDYKGAAGPRSQALWFRVDVGAPEGERVKLHVTSSFGDGEGTTDRDFRTTAVTLRMRGVPGYFPFNRLRITQDLRKEEGLLRERVELYKEGKDGSETPFSKIEEEARLFQPVSRGVSPLPFQRRGGRGRKAEVLRT